jgi:hypothetical protein
MKRQQLKSVKHPTLSVYISPALFTQETSYHASQWRCENNVNKFSEALVDFSLCILIV